MENEYNSEIRDKYFKMDYFGQLLKGNNKFNEFKKQKLLKYGNDAKLFKCKFDNIYFYISNKNCKTFPFYYKECPLCKNKICYFCSKRVSIGGNDNGNCCLKRKLYYLFLYKGFYYFKGLDKVDELKRDDFYLFFILSLIPVFGLFLNIITISGYFCLILQFKNTSKCYSDHFKEIYCCNLILHILLLTSILLSIIFFIYDIYFKIILLIFSLIFKFY